MDQPRIAMLRDFRRALAQVDSLLPPVRHAYDGSLSGDEHARLEEFHRHVGQVRRLVEARAANRSD